MEPNAPLVMMDNVSFSYDRKSDVLQGINIALNPRDFLVVLGANGAGKSTLCYLISGVIPNIYGGTRRGSVLVGGIDPWEKRMYEMCGHCGIVLQDPETQLLMPRVDMEAYFGPSNMGVPRDEILERTEYFINVVGLSGLERRSTQALSGGQKQRAALASVLTMKSNVLVLDEPTSQLDPRGSREVVEALQNLAQNEDIAVVMTTHKLDEVMGIATHCLLLEKGHAMKQGSFEEVISDTEALEKAGVQTPVICQVLTTLGVEKDKLAGLSPEEGFALIDRKMLGGSLNGAEAVSAPSSSPIPKPPDRDEAGSPRAVLEIENLEVTYPGPPPVTALRDVSLRINEGDFVGIVGQNGSGKTTLVKTIVGLLRPSKGHILYRGESIASKRVGEITRHIGLVLQNPDYQLFNISVASEVEFGLNNLKLDRQTVSGRTKEVLKLLGLEEHKETFPFKLSFGDRRKLSVAAVLAMGPDVLILDEPTTAQDYRGRYLLADVAEELRQHTGRAVIMITHDMDLVAKYASRLLVFHAGHVLAQGPTDEIFQEEELLAKAWLRPPAAAQAASALGLPRGIMTPEALVEALQQRMGGGA